MPGELLTGKVAFVTGGAIGIGRGVARALSAAGASVALSWHRHAVEGKELINELEGQGRDALGLELDLATSQDVAGAIEQVMVRFGRLDILVNNTGGLVAREHAKDMTDELWNTVIALNLGSAFYCSRAAIPCMADGGRIINISSLAGRNGGGAGNTAYAAAKAGVFGLTRALAKELAPRSITVNAVAPGLILDTPFHDEFTPRATQHEIVQSLPLGRAGYPADVAGAVLWLSGDSASWITGEVININGGQYFG